MTTTQALGWALVHSLWQCALAAVGLASLLSGLPSRAARIRYALSTGTLVLMVALPLGTALSLLGRSPWTPDSTAGVLAPASTLVGPAMIALRFTARVRTVLEPVLPEVVVLWVAGVIAFSLRLASQWMAAHRLLMMGTRPPPPACTGALERVAARLHVTRPVRIVESALVQVPAVLGWLRPVILLPASILTGLTPLQLDALLAHELVHIRRYDYVVNLLQSVIETLLFYHPAVWWVSRRVREEREHCCDDLVVAVFGDVHLYAQALLGIERLRGTGPALASTVAGGSLVHRIRRVVAPVPAETLPPWAAGAIAVALAVVIGTGSYLVRGSAALWESSASSPTRAIAPHRAPTEPNTALGTHESASPLDGPLEQGESELPARPLRPPRPAGPGPEGVTPPDPRTLLSNVLVPVEIRRAPTDPRLAHPEADWPEPRVDQGLEVQPDTSAPRALHRAHSRVGISGRRALWRQPVFLGSMGVLLTGFADQSVRVGVQEEVQEDDGGEPRVAGSRISQWSTPVALGIGAGLLGAGLGTRRPGLARTGRDALVAMGVAGLLTTTANIAVGRANPQANQGTDYFAPFSSPSRNKSFPSGQTSRAFAFASAVAAHTRQPALRVAAYGAATVVGIAEVVADQRFASDVVAGAVLGTLVGRGVVHHFATAAPRVGLSVTAAPGHLRLALSRSF